MRVLTKELSYWAGIWSGCAAVLSQVSGAQGTAAHGITGSGHPSTHIMERTRRCCMLYMLHQ